MERLNLSLPYVIIVTLEVMRLNSTHFRYPFESCLIRVPGTELTNRAQSGFRMLRPGSTTGDSEFIPKANRQKQKSCRLRFERAGPDA
jgi:hypothetical protein